MKFEVGEKVLSEAFGKGSVSRTTSKYPEYPIEVEFPNNMVQYFTTNGDYIAGDPDPLFDIVKVRATMIYEIRDLINSISELENDIEEFEALLESKFAPSDWEIRRPVELRHKVTKHKIKLIKKMKKYLKENKIRVEVYHIND